MAALATGLQQAARLVDTRKAEAQAIAAALATTIAPSVADRRRRDTARTLSAIARLPDISYICVLDDAGRLVFEHGSGGVLKRASGAGDVSSGLDRLSALLASGHEVEVPVVYGGRTVGTLRLLADLSGLKRALLEGVFTALLIGLAAAAVGVAVALHLQAAITGPIRNLTRSIRDIGETKDFTRSVERHSEDETGILVDAFNAMMCEIRDRDSALTRHRETLEQTVAERTRDLDQARLAVERANAAKSEFLSVMSHEIRTPMNGMLAMAELLAARQAEPRLARYADVIVKSGQSLLTIINDILDFSKIEAGRLELERLPVAPRAMVGDVLELFAEQASSKGLDLAGYVAPAVPETIAADPLRLQQVLVNLVNNALKFTATGGVEIIVRAEDAPEPGPSPAEAFCHLAFDVRDTGIGIPADRQATIFDVFSQADQSTTRRYGGTGIGLAICRRLAEGMGGCLGVESEPGAGATFTVRAPFEVIDPALPATPLPEGPAPVAIVEVEEPLSRRALAGTLADWGFLVCAPGDDAAAVANATLLVAEPGWFDSPAGAALVHDRAATTPAVAVASIGDAAAERLLATGRVLAALERPLTPLEMRRLACAALQGPSELKRLSETDRPSARQTVSYAGIRVLAADDSAVNREVLAEVLDRFAVELTSVEDGGAAVELAGRETFDLIFMDCSMAGLDGYEATRRIRAREEAEGRSAVPIIALTAHVAQDQGARAREAGMSDFLSKPFTLATIEACLARWLASPANDIPTPALDAAHDERLPPAQLAEGSSDKQAAPLLDDAVVDSIREIDGAEVGLLDRVAGLYREHAPRALSRLETAAHDGGSLEACASAAHALKSSSRNIGAKRVGDMAGEIETAASDRSSRPDAAILAELAAALSATLDALARLTAKEAA